jgi:type I restriction enzyme S subunit
MFGLSAEVLKEIYGYLHELPAIERVLLYGSRAKGSHKPGSDIDLTLLGRGLTHENSLLPLMRKLDESSLPYLFDLSIFAQLSSTTLIDHILRVGKIFYLRPAMLPEHWNLTKLGDVCKVIGGGTPSKKNEAFYGGDIPWATVRDLCTDMLMQTEYSVTPEAIKKSSSNVIPANNVIIATRVGLGKVCIIQQDTAINQDLRGIIPIDGQINVRYLFFWFKSISEKIIAAGTGATVQGVKVPFVKALKIPVPPLPEQEAIVAILDQAFAAIDQAKAKLEQNIANAKELFQSKLNAVFSRNGDGWVETPLGSLIEVKHGFAFKSQYFTDNGEHVLLTPGNFYEEGGYRDRGAKQKYYEGEIPKDFVLSKGDLLVAMTEQAAGLLGSPLLVPESGKFLHNQRLGLIQKKTDQPLDNRFLFHAFNTKDFRQHLHDTGTGVKVRHTSPTKIKQARLSLTFDPQQQKAVVDMLEALKSKTDVMVQAYQSKLSRLDELKKGVLEKAFSGRLTSADSL